MTSAELEKRTLDLLVEGIGPELKELINRLARRGMSFLKLETVLVRWIRKASGREKSVIELAALEYVNRIARGEIELPPAPPAHQ